MSFMTNHEWIYEYLAPFITLSYPVSVPAARDSFTNAQHFRIGLMDICLMITLIAVMAVLRDMFRIYACEPFARWKLTRDFKYQARKNTKNGNAHSATSDTKLSRQDQRKLNHAVIRFAEQGWAFLYAVWAFSYGLWLYVNLPSRISNPETLWIGYPHYPIAGPVKFYYLVQLSFWIHQVLTLNAEEHRKDHWQMMTHHAITITLVSTSYVGNFTRVGSVILLLHDLCDVFLPAAKMLRYLGLQLLCDITFGLFMVSWFITRHVMSIIVLYSLLFDLPRIVNLRWDPANGVFISRRTWMFWVSLLGLLQVIQWVWFVSILRVAYRVLSGDSAADVRSDEENSEDEKEE